MRWQLNHVERATEYTDGALPVRLPTFEYRQAHQLGRGILQTRMRTAECRTVLYICTLMCWLRKGLQALLD